VTLGSGSQDFLVTMGTESLDSPASVTLGTGSYVSPQCHIFWDSLLYNIIGEQGWPSTLDKVSMADIDTLKVSMSIDPINHRHFNFFF